MAPTSVTVTLDDDILEQIDAVARARGCTREELVQQACRALLGQIQSVNRGEPAPQAQHAVHAHPGAAALWAAAWIDEVIEPEDR